MPENPNDNTDIQLRNKNELAPEKSLRLGGDKDSILDLSGLLPEQIQALKIKSAEGSIDVVNRAQKIATDAKALDVKLSSMATEAENAAAAGLSINITNTKDDELGRTEIIIGNTEASEKGVLTRSQSGMKDNTLLWLGFIVIVIAIIAGTLIYIYGGNPNV